MEVIFTKKMKRITLVALAMFLFSAQGLLAQNDGDYRSGASGFWSASSTWEVYDENTETWGTATAIPSASSVVYIMRGHSVTLNSNGECLNLNIDADSVAGQPKAWVLLGNNILEVSGKLRAFATSYNTASLGVVNLTSGSTGKIRFVGGTRTLIGSNEWSQNSNKFNAEINLTSGAQGLLDFPLGVKDLLITAGLLHATGNRIYAEGNITINGAGEIITNVSGNPAFSNVAGGDGGTLTVNGKLTFAGLNPSIEMTTVNMGSGTIVYERTGTGTQNIITDNNGSPITYNNLNLNLTSTKQIPAGRTLIVNGALSHIGGTLRLNAANLVLNGALSGTAAITGDNLATISIGGTNTTPLDLNFVTGAQELRRLTINRASGTVNLGTPLTITERLILTSGILYSTTPALLTLKDQSVGVLNANDDSYVDGPVAWNIDNSATGTSTLNFPIGKGGAYRPVSLFMTQGIGVNTYTAEQFNSAPTVRDIPLDSLTHVSAVRYFSINQTGSATVDAGYVQLTYRPDDFVNDPFYLRIAKSNNNAWENLGQGSHVADVNFDDPAGTIKSSLPFTTFSDFVLANAKGGWNSLPVELISFDAKLQGSQVNINWATATEVNNDRFVVERSANGETFAEIATVKGKGNTARISKYAVTDNEPLAGTSYYRLKQVDADGTVTYSKMAAVMAKGLMGAVTLYPNPVTDNLTIVLPVAGKVSVKVLNMLGQAVINTEVSSMSGNEVNLNVASLPAGSYQVVVTGANGSTAAKFIKTGF